MAINFHQTKMMAINFLYLIETIRNLTKPFKFERNHLKSNGTIQNRTKPFEIIREENQNQTKFLQNNRDNQCRLRTTNYNLEKCE